jgi:hypothetical protein
MTDALVHLRVPPALKARWVRESRAAGMRLTDWIVQRVEAHNMDPKHVAIGIPEGLKFADLKLARDPATGDVSFDVAVIERICEASGLPADYFMVRPEEALSGLLTSWYRAHIASGGAPDPVQEDLIAEALAEDERGGGLSHQPGRA